MRIIIAEDDLTSRLMLKSVLEKGGHEVLAARDGNEAWGLLSAPDSPRLGILDWMMPLVDGVELCRRVRAAAQGLPHYLILLTTRDAREDIVQGLDAGANDYVIKPFEHGELLARVRVAERVIQLQESLDRRVKELEHAKDHIRTLQGLLPICMHCRKIRTDGTQWDSMEKYIEEHSDAHFTHGLCPDCFAKEYPEQWKALKKDE
jgi:DNA-binding response OmpR family regulator